MGCHGRDSNHMVTESSTSVGGPVPDAFSVAQVREPDVSGEGRDITRKADSPLHRERAVADSGGGTHRIRDVRETPQMRTPNWNGMLPIAS